MTLRILKKRVSRGRGKISRNRKRRIKLWQRCVRRRFFLSQWHFSDLFGLLTFFSWPWLAVQATPVRLSTFTDKRGRNNEQNNQWLEQNIVKNTCFITLPYLSSPWLLPHQQALTMTQLLASLMVLVLVRDLTICFGQWFPLGLQSQAAVRRRTLTKIMLSEHETYVINKMSQKLKQ